jgi:predicted MPP superfamily phosphohydrolase
MPSTDTRSPRGSPRGKPSGAAGAPGARALSRRRLHLRLAVLVLALALLGALQAFWLEPRHLLVRDVVTLGFPEPSPVSPTRWIHLSDLHIRKPTPVLRRLLDAVRTERPDLLVITGDLITPSHDLEVTDRRLATVTGYVTELRRVAPVVAVQGHSEYQGEVVAALARAGVRWLSNEGLRVDPDGPLLLGLNQQVGLDASPGSDGGLHLEEIPVFELREVGARDDGPEDGRALVVVREGSSDNLYLHWDPFGGPRGRRPGARLGDTRGPLSWSGYELTCEVWIADRDDGAGVVVHSRFVVGEDRMIRLRRVGPDAGDPGTFRLVPHGTAFTSGEPDTGVAPEPRRWYRVRVRTEVEGEGDQGLVRVRARVWPADAPEPRAWQAEVEDRSATRVTAGTVGLWGWEEGGAAYRHLRVRSDDGEVLLEEPFTGTGPELPGGWREGTRGSRLALALARSPAVPPGTPRIVLSHTPGVVLEAAHRGLDVVLAGHTHGGQVRLPLLGALATRSLLGPHYDRGVFRFGSPALQGWTTLYVSSGVGTSILPVRTFDPPRYAEIYPMGGGRR